MSGALVDLKSNEGNYVYFRLQLILSRYNIQIREIRKNEQKFDPPFESYVKIDAAVDVSQSPERAESLKSNTEREIIFQCGMINQKIQAGTSEQHRYRMLLLKIAVKQMLPLFKNSGIKNEQLFPTDGYDTVYLANREQELKVFTHDYAVRDCKQYLWEYEVDYVYTNNTNTIAHCRKWSAEEFCCENCRDKLAEYYCPEEKELYCLDCYGNMHRSERKSKHQREVLNPFNCCRQCKKAQHQAERMEYYCFNCKELKCQYCIEDKSHFKFSHNAGKEISRNLIEVNAVVQHQFENVRVLIKQLKKQQQQLCGSAMAKIIKKVKEVENKIARINNGYEGKLKQIQQEMAKKVRELKKLTTQQLNKAVAWHVELKRRYDEYLWIGQFVKYAEGQFDALTNIELRDRMGSYIECIQQSLYDMLLLLDKQIKTFT